MQQTIMVPFRGAGSGTEELTWGQWTVWRMMSGFGSVFMVGGAMKLEDGTTLEHIEHLLAFVMARHESLRTRIRTGPDGDPRQVLSESGDVALAVIDTEDGEDPAAVAEAVRAPIPNAIRGGGTARTIRARGSWPSAPSARAPVCTAGRCCWPRTRWPSRASRSPGRA